MLQASQHYNQKSGLLTRFVSDVSYIFNIFTMDKRAGTHHDLPSPTQKVPTPREERKPVLLAKRAVEFTRAEAALKAEAREKSWFLLGPNSKARAAQTDPLVPPPRTTPTTAPTSPSPPLHTSPLQFSHSEPNYAAQSGIQKRDLLADQYEIHACSSNPLTPDRVEMDDVDGMSEMYDLAERHNERHYERNDKMNFTNDMHEMDYTDEVHEMDMDRLRMSDMNEMNEMHELDELDELGEHHADKLAALDELGELVDDLDEVERQEKVEKKALFKMSKYAAVELSEEQTYNQAPAPATFSPESPFSNATQFNEFQFSNEDEKVIII
jgi:hypothetical protein